VGNKQQHVGQILGLPRSTVGNMVNATGPEVDESIPPDHPPRIEAPGARKPRALVNVSEGLVRVLKRDYGRGVPTDDGRQLGDLAEVAEWIAGLKVGKARPRT
jgi:hypothetical protein